MSSTGGGAARDPAGQRAEPAAGAPPPRRHAGLWLVAAAAMCAAAGLLTPNGLRGLLYPFRAMAQIGQAGMDLRGTISEMGPLLSLPGALPITVAAFKLSLAWAALWLIATAGRVSVLRIVVLFLAAGATLYSQRNLGFYALAFYLVHSGARPGPSLWWLRGWLARSVRTAGTGAMPWSTTARWLTIAVAAAVSLWWWGSLRNDSFYLAEGVSRRFGTGLTPAHYPLAVTARLKAAAAQPSARIINNIDCAGLLIDQSAGRVYIDGRTEAYPPSLWQEYRLLRQGQAPALQIIQKRAPVAIILTHGGTSVQPLVQTMLESRTWFVDAADEAGLLLLPAAGLTAEEAAEQTRRSLQDAAARLLTELSGNVPAGMARGRAARVIAADRCLALGGLMRQAKLPGEAEKLYRRGLVLAPDHPLLNHNYGNLLLARGEFGRALDHFRAALQVNGRLAPALINAGICLGQLGDLDSAEKSLLRAIRLDRRRAEAWVSLAEVRRQRGDRPGALRAYAEALRLLPGDERLRQRVALYRAGS